MTISSKILGYPGQDNNVYVKIDSGQHIYQLFFDCGDSGLSHLGKGILQYIDFLFFSHCHVDHIAGFDSLFRHLYSRNYPLNIFGPTNIINIIHSRLQGFSWNLIKKCKGEVIVHEINNSTIKTAKFLCKEGFSICHNIDEKSYEEIIYQNEDFFVKTCILNHNIPCLAFSLEENNKLNINTNKMKTLELKPGKWCSLLKQENLLDNYSIKIEDREYKLDFLKKELLEIRNGEKIVYATDFIMNNTTHDILTSFSKNAKELIIESMYKNSEKELAKKNFHLTVDEVARLAKDANVKKLFLFHVSDRYSKNDLLEILTDAKIIFSESYFPAHWKI